VFKLFAIAFTCVYLHLTVGVVKTTHYCLGRESGFSYYSFSVKSCACSAFLSKLEKSPCCSDKTDLIQLDEDQTATVFASLTEPELFELGNLYETIAVSTISKSVFNPEFFNTKAPPLKVPLYRFFNQPKITESCLS
jgi:hypothetical protein